MTNDLYAIASIICEQFTARQLILSTAESCTGGMIAQTLTAIPGSSHYFDRGFVTYSNAAKQEMLSVSPATLLKYGAVSQQTASEMAAGVLRNSHATISLAITGIAGPDGGTIEKPVGTVWFAWAKQANPIIQTQNQLFTGNRQTIREQATIYCLQQLIKFSQN